LGIGNWECSAYAYNSFCICTLEDRGYSLWNFNRELRM